MSIFKLSNRWVKMESAFWLRTTDITSREEAPGGFFWSQKFWQDVVHSHSFNFTIAFTLPFSSKVEYSFCLSWSASSDIQPQAIKKLYTILLTLYFSEYRFCSVLLFAGWEVDINLGEGFTFSNDAIWELGNGFIKGRKLW